MIQWYTRHAEDSANRITELKLDCGGDTLPCSECDANALYVLLSALSYTLCALMWHLLPEDLSHHRTMTLRWRLCAMAANLVKTGRHLCVKLRAHHRDLLDRVLLAEGV